MSNPYRPDDDGAAGYGQPSSGQPSHGQPSHGQPSYGQPASYDTPAGYGSPQDAPSAPGYGTPSPYATTPYSPTPYSPTPYATGPYATYPPQQNQLALIALICSLAGLVTGVSVFAGIICGHIALSQLRQNPQQTGRGLAVASLWVGYGLLALGIIGIVLYIVLILSLVNAPY